MHARPRSNDNPIFVRNLIFAFLNNKAGNTAQTKSMIAEKTWIQISNLLLDRIDEFADRLTGLNNNYLFDRFLAETRPRRIKVPAFTDWIALE